jgi:hypothetical protein
VEARPFVWVYITSDMAFFSTGLCLCSLRSLFWWGLRRKPSSEKPFCRKKIIVFNMAHMSLPEKNVEEKRTA